MVWPPPVFENTFTNSTDQLDDHPNIHNEVNSSLNADFRPKIDDNAARLTANDALIAGNSSDLSDHEDTDDTPRTLRLARTNLDFFNTDTDAPVIWTNDGVAASFRAEGHITISWAHRRVLVAFRFEVMSNVTGVSPGNATFAINLADYGFPLRSSAGTYLGGSIAVYNGSIWTIGVANWLSNATPHIRHTIRLDGGAGADNASPGNIGDIYSGAYVIDVTS